jgi:hypothetical protein
MAYTRPANSSGARAADSANKLDKKRSTIRKQPILHSYIRRAPIVPLVAPRPAGAGRMLTDLLSAYAWPKNQLGGGVVAIISCFGGWRPEDVSAFAETLSQPVADVIDVPIDATNDPVAMIRVIGRWRLISNWLLHPTVTQPAAQRRSAFTGRHSW